MSIRRVNKELKVAPRELDADGHGICLTEVQDENIMDQVWTICPSSGAYMDHSIKINVLICSQYPFKPPKIALQQNIFHPNVDDYKMCLGTVNEWHPKSTICDIMKEIQGLLVSPNLDTALCVDAMELYKQDLKAYNKRALESVILKN